MNVPTLEQLEDACAQVTAAWGMRGGLDILFDGVAYAHLETVLHEASHAASLGIPFDKRTSSAVSKAVHALEQDFSDSLLGIHSDAAFDEEAKAWAIEWELIHRLELDDTYTWETTLESAAEQGVDQERLERFLNRPEALAGADRVMAWLRELETTIDQWEK